MSSGQHFQSIIPTSDSKVCRNCAQQGINSINKHFRYKCKDECTKSEVHVCCKRMYDLALLEAQSKANLRKRSRESSARYKEKNKEQIKEKHADYNAKKQRADSGKAS